MCTCGCSKGNDSGVYTILLYENSIKFNSYYNQLKYLHTLVHYGIYSTQVVSIQHLHYLYCMVVSTTPLVL